MGRKRLKKNQGLEPNLYLNGRGYFYYIHPKTKRPHSMGSNRAKANKAARILNSRLMEGADLVAKVLDTNSKTMNEVLDIFEREFLPEKGYAASSLKQIEIKLKRYRKEFGNKQVRIFDVLFVSRFLENFTSTSYIKNRQLLIDIFKVAKAKGLFQGENPAEVTLRKSAPKRVRKRLDMALFKAIHKHAEPWLQNAMDLALITLQRRGDIVEIRFEDIDGHHLKVIQNKTNDDGQNEKAFLRIQIGADLKGVLKRCRASGIVSPFVIHARPERRSRKHLDAKDHWTQVSAESVTRKFKEARDACGAFKGWTKGTEPGFHEIRSLGGHLYEETGYPKEYINNLMGHTSIKMTDAYLAGHEIRWTECRADLPLSKLREED